MRMPSRKLRRSLEKATLEYEKNRDLATSYLSARGIDPLVAEKWRLGVVASPEPGHEHAAGRLSIPYTNRLGVIGLKFRCLIGHDCKAEKCPKYLQPLGQEDYLFNVLDVDEEGDTLHVTEGELDAIVLKAVLGEPVCGVAGATKWREHYPWHYKGWSRVLVWPDGDKAGDDLGSRFRKEVPAAEIVPMPQGHDITSLYVELGAEAIQKLAGKDDEDED